MTSQQTLPADLSSLEADKLLLDRVLEPYKTNCRYLKTARVEQGDCLTLHATFEIPESCYIAATGHFNSVEFNICYNQMAYYLIAKAAQESLIEPFDSWTMADYWQRQLPNVLIADFQSKFRRPMQGAAFSGTLTFSKITQRSGDRPLVIIETVCGYSDGAGGHADGAVKLVITNPPSPR
ncbi:FcoT family thioesterase [Streptomyces sp. DSM 42041]|uniref:(2E)-enoyl-[ACP] glycyltransferase n=1 Tax=Streptomyces hazeniae TaxID=3075538 RepID=A0ABU2NYU3_9ACTN|nr:FcoT family thioesterase [Streptomyces sp. DSM 42041]MDT0382153.1 FcoT family thioesterase [Streptomyces sp. DSM 42041]